MCEPLYNVEEHDWIKDWTEEVAPGLELPELLRPSEVAGEITAEAAEATGLPAGIPVAVGTIDAFAEAVSVGVQNPGDLMLVYRTTMTIRGFDRVGKDLPGDASFEELTEGAREVAPGSDGLVVLPYFAGERTAHKRPGRAV